MVWAVRKNRVLLLLTSFSILLANTSFASGASEILQKYRSASDPTERQTVLVDGLSGQELVNFLTTPGLTIGEMRLAEKSTIPRLLKKLSEQSGSRKPRIHPSIFALLQTQSEIIDSFGIALPNLDKKSEVPLNEMKRVEDAFGEFMKRLIASLGPLGGCNDLLSRINDR